MLKTISAKELAEWEAYEKIEPFGQPFLQSGIIASTIFNMNKGRNQKIMSAENFIPKYRKPQTVEEQMEILKGLARDSEKQGRKRRKKKRKK